MKSPGRRQSGVVLLGIMLLLLLASGQFLIAYASRFANSQERELITGATLQQARDALIFRATTDENRPGSMPCPDFATNNPGKNVPGDGVADLLVGNACPSYVGLLPWRTLDLPDLRDASGERLWYVLSPNFRDSDAVAINNTTVSTLSVDGEGNIAALIIAPGSALTGQSRPSKNPADYLDKQNSLAAIANGESYFSGPASEAFNDRVAILKTSVLFSAVSQKILAEIRYAYIVGGQLEPYVDTNGDGFSDPPPAGEIAAANGRFPFRNPAYDLASPSWYISETPPPIQHRWYESLESNGWFALVNYDRNTKSLTLNGRTLVLPSFP